MTDFSRMKRRSTLGAPPSMEEASTNLLAPEIAPLPSVALPVAEMPVSVEPPMPKPTRGSKRAAPTRIDGRSLRRTGRTVQFNTSVTEEFLERLRRIAQREDRKFVEVLERALMAYDRQGHS